VSKQQITVLSTFRASKDLTNDVNPHLLFILLVSGCPKRLDNSLESQETSMAKLWGGNCGGQLSCKPDLAG
jgi:hypothetical protein